MLITESRAIINYLDVILHGFMVQIMAYLLPTQPRYDIAWLHGTNHGLNINLHRQLKSKPHKHHQKPDMNSFAPEV